MYSNLPSHFAICISMFYNFYEIKSLPALSGLRSNGDFIYDYDYSDFSMTFTVFWGPTASCLRGEKVSELVLP